MLKFKLRQLIGAAMVGIWLAASVMPALSIMAADPTQSGQGLEISPPVIELNADPGQTVVANIRIRNITDQTLIAKGKVDDFVAQGEEGQPKILVDASQTSSFSLKALVSSVPDLTLVPKEVKTASVSVVVPKNGTPGGHYGVIRFTAVPPGLEGSGVSLSASLGSLVLLNVSGQQVQKASMAEFSVAHNGKAGSFFQRGPLTFTERISNEGNVHVKPTGDLVIKGLFGTVATMKVNDPPRNILPESTRRFEETLNRKFMLGRYTASMDLSYANDKNLKVSKVFWVIPYDLVIFVLLLIIVLFFVIRSSLRRYNRYIIAKAKRN